MAGGLAALLDDIAVLAKAAAASVDDVAAAATIALPFAPSLPWLVGILCLYGVGAAALSTAPTAALGDAAPQTDCTVLKTSQIDAFLLEKAGCTLAEVVKINVWLDDPRDFQSFNRVYAGYFGDAPPARACVKSALMVDAKVEIDAIAYRGA